MRSVSLLGRLGVCSFVLYVSGCSPRVVESQADAGESATTSGEAPPTEGSTGSFPQPPPVPPDDEPDPFPEPTTTSGDDESSGSSGGFVSGVLQPGHPTECLVGGNMLVLDGEPEDYIHPGYEVLPPGVWAVETDGDPIAEVSIAYRRDEPDRDFRNWTVRIRSSLIPAGLGVGVYEDAQRTPFEDEGRPGLSVYGDGRGCNRLSGAFEVHELETAEGSLRSVTLTWSQYCEEGDDVLLGCVHWESQ